MANYLLNNIYNQKKQVKFEEYFLEIVENNISEIKVYKEKILTYGILKKIIIYFMKKNR